MHESHLLKNKFLTMLPWVRRCYERVLFIFSFLQTGSYFNTSLHARGNNLHYSEEYGYAQVEVKIGYRI